jgi:hypothetical protein
MTTLLKPSVLWQYVLAPALSHTEILVIRTEILVIRAEILVIRTEILVIHIEIHVGDKKVNLAG